MTKLTEIASSRAVVGIFCGKSTMPGGGYFATIRGQDGSAIVTGKGSTVEAALDDAANKMPGGRVQTETRPLMPGMTR